MSSYLVLEGHSDVCVCVCVEVRVGVGIKVQEDELESCCVKPGKVSEGPIMLKHCFHLKGIMLR